MDTIATPNNMRKFESVSGMLAYSPLTGEEYSATPGDYFLLQPDAPLLDSEGEPMVLVVRVSDVFDVSELQS